MSGTSVRAVSTKPGHGCRLVLKGGLELALILQDDPTHALCTWGFADAGP